MEHNDPYLCLVKSYFNPAVELVYDNEPLGKIYKTNILRAPEDSLIEYYWNGNYILVGSLQRVEEDKNKYFLDLMVPYIDNMKYHSSISIKQDTLYILTIAAQNEKEYTKTSITQFNRNIGIHIYGDEYSFEDSYRLASYFIYGKLESYDILDITQYPPVEE